MSSFIDDFETTVVECRKISHQDFRAEKSGILRIPATNAFDSNSAKMSSEIHRSYEDFMAGKLKSKGTPRPISDSMNVRTVVDTTITDRPLCMTFDSGISSPGSAIIQTRTENHRPLSGHDAAIANDLQKRLKHLKSFVEDKLQNSIDEIKASNSQESLTLSEIKEHMCRLAEACVAVSRSSQNPEDASAKEMFVERALNSSLLVFENNKLSAEIAFLKKKVEILEDVAGTKGFTLDAEKPTVETISMGSQTDEPINQSSIMDEIDFGLSDFLPDTPETNRLMNAGFCRDDLDFPLPSSMSTPGVAPNKAQRRKIEVPSHLKVTSTSYLSINPWAEVDDKQESGSSIGCWRGLCACFYNNSHVRHH